MSTHRTTNLPAPDVLPVVVGWLAAHPAVAAMAARVSVDLTGFTAGERWVSVANIVPGSRDGSGVIVRIPLDINAYAEDKPTAHKLARTVIAALLDLWGVIRGDVIVCAVEPVLEPFVLTDPDNSAARFVAQVAVFARNR